MDVSRGLRPSGLLGPAQGQGESAFRGCGNNIAPAGSDRNQHPAISDTAHCHFLLRRRTTGSGVSVLWLGIRAATVEGGRTPATRRVDNLSSVVVRTKRDTVQSRQKLIRVDIPGLCV
jgi:hypothetical protein